jgi:peptide-methionine (R)-S-oxide reductase
MIPLLSKMGLRIILFLSVIAFSCTKKVGDGSINTSTSSTGVTLLTGTDSLHSNNPYYSHTDTTVLRVADEEWQKILPEEVYQVARNKKTERAFKGKFWNFTGRGTYYCAACGNTLFRSDAKFASTCGWPSFFEPQRKNSVTYQADHSFNRERTEVLCGRCDAL